MKKLRLFGSPSQETCYLPVFLPDSMADIAICLFSSRENAFVNHASGLLGHQVLQFSPRTNPAQRDCIRSRNMVSYSLFSYLYALASTRQQSPPNSDDENCSHIRSFHSSPIRAYSWDR